MEGARVNKPTLLHRYLRISHTYFWICHIYFSLKSPMKQKLHLHIHFRLCLHFRVIAAFRDVITSQAKLWHFWDVAAS